MKVWWRAHRVWDNPGAATGTRASAEWLAEAVMAVCQEARDTARAGAYVATPDAGADVSVSFWRDALASGVDFANPRDFPWTLASSLAAHAAERAGIRGPNYTLVGGAEAMMAAIHQAIDDLSAGHVGLALVAGIDCAGGWQAIATPSAAVVGLVLKGEGTLASLQPSGDHSEAEEREETAAGLLVRACRVVEGGGSIIIGAKSEGWIQVLSTARGQ